MVADCLDLQMHQSFRISTKKDIKYEAKTQSHNFYPIMLFGISILKTIFFGN
jgi:hypothetical protein